MKHKSIDFKKHIIKLYNSNIFSINTILKLANISNGTLYNWINKFNNDKLDRKVTIKKSKITCKIKCYIFNNIMKQNTLNWRTMIKSIKNTFNIFISKSYLYVIIKKLNLTKKKIRIRNIYKSKEKLLKDKANFNQTIKKHKLKDIISIDETSIDTFITDLYGWNKKGKRIIKEKFNMRRIRWTLICGISNKRIISSYLIKGSATKESFNKFMKTLPTNKIYLMDNARIHHNKDLKIKVGNKIIYNVPYSPETNPIEMLFSELKCKLRKELIINEKTITNCLISCNNNLNSYFKHSLGNLCK